LERIRQELNNWPLPIKKGKEKGIPFHPQLELKRGGGKRSFYEGRKRGTSNHTQTVHATKKCKEGKGLPRTKRKRRVKTPPKRQKTSERKRTGTTRPIPTHQNSNSLVGRVLTQKKKCPPATGARFTPTKPAGRERSRTPFRKTPKRDDLGRRAWKGQGGGVVLKQERKHTTYGMHQRASHPSEVRCAKGAVGRPLCAKRVRAQLRDGKSRTVSG